MPLDGRQGAVARYVLEANRCRRIDARRLRPLGDCLRERVFGLAFDRSGQAEQVGLGQARHLDVYDLGLTPGQRAGLIHHNDLYAR